MLYPVGVLGNLSHSCPGEVAVGVLCPGPGWERLGGVGTLSCSWLEGGGGAVPRPGQSTNPVDRRTPVKTVPSTSFGFGRLLLVARRATYVIDGRFFSHFFWKVEGTVRTHVNQLVTYSYRTR